MEMYRCPTWYPLLSGTSLPKRNSQLHELRCRPPPQRVSAPQPLEFFQCEVCQVVMYVNEREDHLFAHSLQDEESNSEQPQQARAQVFSVSSEDESISPEEPPSPSFEREHLGDPFNLDRFSISQRLDPFSRMLFDRMNSNGATEALRNQLDSLSMVSGAGVRDSYNPSADFSPEIRHLSSEHYDDDALNQAGVDQLPKIKFDKAHTHEFTECSFCMEDFLHGDCLILLPCFHYFHVKCGSSWLLRKAECPLCKNLV